MMEFLGMGSWEILLILILALIIWGPGRLPEIARTLGKTVRTLRKATFDLTTAVTKEIEGKENDHPLSPPGENPGHKTSEPSSDAGKASAQHMDDQTKSLGGHPQ